MNGKATVVLLAVLTLMVSLIGSAHAQDTRGAADSAAATAPSTIAGGVTSAATEAADAAIGGGESVVRGGRGAWDNVMVPMFRRFGAALPGAIKALLLLLAFWIMAVLAGAGVKRLLGMTKLDDRAASDWGLAPMLTNKQGDRRSVEEIVGSVVKWVILMFGLVAFFQALNLNMVAGPLQNIINNIMTAVPNLLQAAVVLFVYWAVASIIRFASTRGLRAMKFDERAERFIPSRQVGETTVGPSAIVGRLLFYVVLVFGLSPFLDALGQKPLVEPLSGMLAEALGFVPNLVGALVLFFVGHIVATIVREVVTNFLAATGIDGGAERIGLSKALNKTQLSDIAGSIAYFFIIVPVIAAAANNLQIQAVSEPVTRTLESILGAVPFVFVAAIVLWIGYFLARIVRGVVEGFLKGVGFDSLPKKLGLSFLSPGEGRASLSTIAGATVMLVIILLTSQQALATLAFHELADLIGELIGYLPQLVIGLVIILAGLSLATHVGNLVSAAVGSTGHGRFLSLLARAAVIFVGFSMGLNELGIAENIVTVAVSAVLGGTALALGLAFGLGGRDRAKEVIERGQGQ